MYPETIGRVCAIGVFIGFNLTFIPQFIMGSRGMPRRYWDYDPQYTIFHQLSTVGAFVLGISLFITVVYLFASFWNGKLAHRNPWGGATLEWQAPTPPTLYNFEKPPVLHELYNYDDLEEVEPDVWERTGALEDEPARADAIAVRNGTAADHTKGATERDRAVAVIHGKAEEARAETNLTEPSKGAPADPSKLAKDIVDAERRGGGGELRPAEDALDKAGLAKVAEEAEEDAEKEKK
jgi:hypothetical protein